MILIIAVQPFYKMVTIGKSYFKRLQFLVGGNITFGMVFNVTVIYYYYIGLISSGEVQLWGRLQM